MATGWARPILCSSLGAPPTGCSRRSKWPSSPDDPPGNRGNLFKSTGLAGMPVEITETEAGKRDGSGRVETRSPDEDMSVEDAAKSSQMLPLPNRQSTRRRRLLMGVLGALILIAACVFGIPWIRSVLNTVSTDDAYVNGHVTFVAPRVSGQISRVLVDDNY